MNETLQRWFNKIPRGAELNWDHELDLWKDTRWVLIGVTAIIAINLIVVAAGGAGHPTKLIQVNWYAALVAVFVLGGILSGLWILEGFINPICPRFWRWHRRLARLRKARTVPTGKFWQMLEG